MGKYLTLRAIDIRIIECSLTVILNIEFLYFDSSQVYIINIVHTFYFLNVRKL